MPGLTVAGGLCLTSLLAETTNNKWRTTDINGKAATIYKLVQNFDCFFLAKAVNKGFREGSKKVPKEWEFKSSALLEIRPCLKVH